MTEAIRTDSAVKWWRGWYRHGHFKLDDDKVEDACSVILPGSGGSSSDGKESQQNYRPSGFTYRRAGIAVYDTSDESKFYHSGGFKRFDYDYLIVKVSHCYDHPDDDGYGTATFENGAPLKCAVRKYCVTYKVKRLGVTCTCITDNSCPWKSGLDTAGGVKD